MNPYQTQPKNPLTSYEKSSLPLKLHGEISAADTIHIRTIIIIFLKIIVWAQVLYFVFFLELPLLHIGHSLYPYVRYLLH